MQNYYQTIAEIYKRLQDKESKQLFEARLSYLFNRDYNEYTETVRKIYDDWISPELENAIKTTEGGGRYNIWMRSRWQKNLPVIIGLGI